jgi:hypothetical protein
MKSESLWLCEKLAGSSAVTDANDLDFEKVEWADFVGSHGFDVQKIRCSSLLLQHNWHPPVGELGNQFTQANS